MTCRYIILRLNPAASNRRFVETAIYERRHVRQSTLLDFRQSYKLPLLNRMACCHPTEGDANAAL